MVNKLLVVLGFTEEGGPKYDLRKKPTYEDDFNRLRVWFIMNSDFVALALIIGIIVSIAVICSLFVGVSATGDSIHCLEKVI